MSQLDLLMVHADDRREVLPQGLSTDTATETGKPGDRGRLPRMSNDGADPNDLESQRWSVIVPAGDQGRHLLELIEPLIAARSAQQGGRPVKTFAVPSKMELTDAIEWRKKFLETGQDTTEDVPRYQLILGDLDEVPLALQQVLSVNNYVGRLAFADDQGYQAYVDKILRWEKQPQTSTQGRAVMFTVHDQTSATDLGYRALIAPGLDLLRKRMESKDFSASEVVELGDEALADPNELLREVRKTDPSVLFSLSHGLGAPRGGWRSPEEQRKLQGAMSFGREGVISADSLGALSQQPFLPGGVWFMLACYGAGTPDTSAYHQWLAKLAKVGQFKGQPQAVLAGLPKPGDRPFIAALPQAVLRNEQGPLAFMGHIDLAWSYSFAELDSGKLDTKPGRFMNILRYLLKCNRVGVAYKSLMSDFTKVNDELAVYSARYDGGQPEDPAAAAKRGHLWMLRQDLGGYILLGDPAARLPLQPSAAVQPRVEIDAQKRQEAFLAQLRAYGGAAPAPAPAPRVTPGVSQSSATQAPVTNPPAALPRSLEKMEEAFGWLLTGTHTLEQEAAGLALDPTELQRLYDLYRQGGRGALGIKP